MLYSSVGFLICIRMMISFENKFLSQDILRKKILAVTFLKYNKSFTRHKRATTDIAQKPQMDVTFFLVKSEKPEKNWFRSFFFFCSTAAEFFFCRIVTTCSSCSTCIRTGEAAYAFPGNRLIFHVHCVACVCCGRFLKPGQRFVCLWPWVTFLTLGCSFDVNAASEFSRFSCRDRFVATGGIRGQCSPKFFSAPSTISLCPEKIVWNI